MLSFFRRKAPPQPPTFNERVTAFWRWYQDVAPRFYAAIEDGKCAALGDETSARVNALLPHFAWVFGPGANGQGHSFTLSGEGNTHRQLLALQWLSRAPVIDGWTFHAARQPGPIKGHTIRIDGLTFDPREIWVAASVDTGNENIDLTIWHPAWDRIEERQKQTITFLFLDEALGEYGTDWWIGRLDFSKDRLAAAFPLEELAEHVDAISRQHGWKKHPPGEIWTLFKMHKPVGAFPRGDLLTQRTCVPLLHTAFLEANGELADPLADSGADYIYVSIDSAFFPEGEQVKRRGAIEDAVEATLKAVCGGRCIGGAFGRERTYSDFLIFDGPRSLAAVEQTLRAQRVPPGTMIEYFAREKRGQRIAL